MIRKTVIQTLTMATVVALVSAAVAAVAGIIAVRNPQVISSLIAAFLVDTDPKD